MKKILSALSVLIFVLVLMTTLVTAADARRLYDGADLLNDFEEAELLSRLDLISDSYMTDVVVVTVDSLGEKTPMEYADDYFDAYDFGYGDDGILLLVSMEERDYWISTCGKCIDIFDDYTIESICENIVDHLSYGDYYEAFSEYANDCDYYINGELNGYPFYPGSTAVISAVIGLVAALIVCGIFKGQLKSVRTHSAASSYVKGGSLNITNSNDFFIYRNVTRTPKPTDNSGGSTTHRSSSGKTHGGGGGKF